MQNTYFTQYVYTSYTNVTDFNRNAFQWVLMASKIFNHFFFQLGEIFKFDCFHLKYADLKLVTDTFSIDRSTALSPRYNNKQITHWMVKCKA